MEEDGKGEEVRNGKILRKKKKMIDVQRKERLSCCLGMLKRDVLHIRLENVNKTAAKAMR